MQEFIELAKRLADESGEIIRQYYRRNFDIETKADETPVTIADRKVEERLREMIEGQRYRDGILGEEFGEKDSESGITWVLDPIDGTKAFMTGRPTFGTLIAACEGGVPFLGVIDQPITGDRWIGARYQETTHNGEVVKARSCPSLSKAVGASTSPTMFAGQETARGRDFPFDFDDACKQTIWGGDCVSYGHLASGYLDIVVEAHMQLYDFLAHVPIVEGAGGKICDFEGKPLTMASGDSVVAMGDERLWGDIAKLL